MVAKRVEKSKGKALMMPVWIDNLNSDHDYSRENYVTQVQDTFHETLSKSREYFDGIMVYGMQNQEDLRLREKYVWLKQLFEEIQRPLVGQDQVNERHGLSALIELKSKHNLKFFV